MDPCMQFLDIVVKVCLVVLPCNPIHSSCGARLEFVKRRLEQIGTDMVQERGELLCFLPLLCYLPYAFQRL